MILERENSSTSQRILNNGGKAVTITIPYNEIDLNKCTIQGLELMMEILLCQESFEWAAQVRDELKNRLTMEENKK